MILSCICKWINFFPKFKRILLLSTEKLTLVYKLSKTLCQEERVNRAYRQAVLRKLSNFDLLNWRNLKLDLYSFDVNLCHSFTWKNVIVNLIRPRKQAKSFGLWNKVLKYIFCMNFNFMKYSNKELIIFLFSFLSE